MGRWTPPLLAVILSRAVSALNNGLARTPPLGLHVPRQGPARRPRSPGPHALTLTLTPHSNTWSAYGPAGASAAVLEQVADLFLSTGLASAGYSFVNMDDGEGAIAQGAPW